MPVRTMVIPALRPGGSTSFTFNLGSGPYLISVVDPQDLIVESDKENNVQYEKLLNLR
jgi:subtilase family serine protease